MSDDEIEPNVFAANEAWERGEMWPDFKPAVGYSIDPNVMSSYHNSPSAVAPIEVAPNPDSQAVQLLRDIVAFDPYDQWDIEKSCHFCDSHFGHEHEPDCIYAKAQAFIAALDVK
jgi:hypothetical protein